MAAGSSRLDADDATIIEGAVLRSAQPAPYRSRMMDPVAVAYDPVPALYDLADEGEEDLQYQATMLLDTSSSSHRAPLLAAPAPYRNTGGTLLMPAAQSIEMRDAIMASMRHLPSQHPQPYAQLLAPQPRAANTNGVELKVQRPRVAMSRFELAFAASAALMIGLTAALLFVYFG